MDEISISKFKATCLAVLEKVRITGEPIRVTKFGKAVAEIRPLAVEAQAERKLGWMEGSLGDYQPEEIVRFSAWDRDYAAEEWDELQARSPAKEGARGRRRRRETTT